MCCKSDLNPERMLPNERAAYFHALRVHLQIVTWKLLDDSFHHKPEEWGWKNSEQILSPARNDKEVAPECLLKVIRYKCKSISRNEINAVQTCVPVESME